MDLLFWDKNLEFELQKRKNALLDDVASWDADQLLTHSEHKIVTYLTDKHTVQHLKLRQDQMYVDKPMDGRRSSLRVHLPYEGESIFFFLRPNRFTLNPPRALVERTELVFVFEGRELNDEKIRATLDRNLESIENWLEASGEMVTFHNDAICNTALSAIQQRKETLLTNYRAVEKLGLPVQHHKDSSSVSVPIQRREQHIEQPRQKDALYNPERALSNLDYEKAVEIIINSGKQMERTPTSILEMNEEGRRDVMLVALNSKFAGQASGETLNGSGKTDILLRVDNQNVFIAECKIWRGQSRFTAAIDQLLSYLVWRDTKAALILFIETQGATTTINRALKTLENHPKYLQTVPRSDAANRYDFAFTSLSDEAREISLAFLPVVLCAP